MEITDLADQGSNLKNGTLLNCRVPIKYVKGALIMNDNNKQVYTVQEIMEILSISKNAAYNFIKNDPPFKVFNVGNVYRINKRSFDCWINGDSND